jgi:hypothetical protein
MQSPDDLPQWPVISVTSDVELMPETVDPTIRSRGGQLYPVESLRLKITRERDHVEGRSLDLLHLLTSLLTNSTTAYKPLGMSALSPSVDEFLCLSLPGKFRTAEDNTGG